MKKIFIIALLFTVACVSSSYQDKNTDKQLAKNLKGTWEGSIYIDEEEIPTDYQFFESADGTTGNFIEIAYLHEIDGDFDIRYFAYASGEYSVKNGQLSLTFFPETTYAEPYDEEVFSDYVIALWDFYHEEGREILWEDESELASSVLEFFEDNWSSVCDARNQSESVFGNLSVTENKMSFVAGNETLQFKRADHDWFTAYPFAE